MCIRDRHTLMTLSEIIEQEIPQADVAVMSGPSHAEEVGKGIPTTIVVGSRNRKTAEYLQNIFMNEVFRVYTVSYTHLDVYKRQVFNDPVTPACIHADSRRMWRVIENLFNNICKYAMPGTRVYLDLEKANDLIEVSIKNISEYQLNISPRCV